MSSKDKKKKKSMNIEIYSHGANGGSIYICDKNPSSLQQCPKIHSATEVLFKIAQMLLEYIH